MTFYDIPQEHPSGQNRCLYECIFDNMALYECRINKNAPLQTVFLAILPLGLNCRTITGYIIVIIIRM